jgi:hypothetical protein
MTNENIDMSVAGMLSLQERQYLYEYAKNQYSGSGEIVDLGCWLGSSTIPLAMGLMENSNSQIIGRHIHAYDIFIWEDWMDGCGCVSGSDLKGKFKPGDSFFEEYKKQTSAWGQQICCHPGDLMQLGWQGDDIEFLFIDAMKSWELANSIVNNFFPSLVPGISTVVHQDFSHYYTYWIHLIMYRFRDYFELVYDVPSSGSLSFKYRKQIPSDELNAVYAIDSFNSSEIDAAFRYSTSLVSPDKAQTIQIAKIRSLTDYGADFQKDSVVAALSDLDGQIMNLHHSHPLSLSTRGKRWHLKQIFDHLKKIFL